MRFKIGMRGTAYPKGAGAAVVSSVVENTLGRQRKPTVLTEARRSVVDQKQVLDEVRPGGARSPPHCLLQNADTARRKVLHRVLTQNSDLCFQQRFSTSIEPQAAYAALAVSQRRAGV